MSTLYETENAFKQKYFKYNKLKGLNKKTTAQSNITVEGEIDDFTLSTLYQNYDIIASNLRVYPTVTIYPRESYMEGGFTGYYYSENNHINLIDDYYLISMLAHEMRHAFQYIYIPDFYYDSGFDTVSGYLDSAIERDARVYSYDYCITREYWEEANFISKSEEEIERIVQGKLPTSFIGLSDSYFKENPTTAYDVPRDYHKKTKKRSSFFIIDLDFDF